ncbi:hypothetical protein ACFYVL_09290 [Streptomyces sp. NPDC004111]|uniref:hypothetical protein n=1 Tax=Streptomyces sp. NPDC004111 TaxID=3364690 RepID=UPI0036AA7349
MLTQLGHTPQQLYTPPADRRGDTVERPEPYQRITPAGSAPRQGAAAAVAVPAPSRPVRGR